MKKKLFSVLFALIILPCMFALTACGGNPPEDPHTHSWSSTYTKTATEHYKTCTGCDETSERVNHTGNPCTVCGYETQTPHNHTQCPTCELCTDPDCDGEESEKCQGHGPVDPGPVDPGPVDPEHNHTACPTCGKCTDADCDGEATEKCEGHPQDPQEPVVTTNAYKDLIDTIISECSTAYPITDIVMVDVDSENHITWWAKNGNETIYKYKLNYLTVTLTGNRATDISTMISTLTDSNIMKGDFYKYLDSGYQTFYTMDNNSPLLISLKNKLIGTDYNIIAGGVSSVRGDALDANIGAYSIFDIDLLLEKDGKLYEYNDSIWASNDLQGKDVYQAVTQGTKSDGVTGTYKTHAEVKTLGDLAEDYYSEVLKTKTYKTLVDTIISQCTTLGTQPITDVIAIDVDEDNYIVWWASNAGSQIKKYKLDYWTVILTGNTETDIQTMIDTLTDTEVMRGDFVLVDTYTSDKTLTSDYTLISNLKNKLVGTDYNIIAGGVSNTYGSNLHPTLGEISMFDLELLLEKDGKLYEYKDSILASSDLQDKDVYEACYDGTKDVTYIVQSTIVELGDIAEDYWTKR